MFRQQFCPRRSVIGSCIPVAQKLAQGLQVAERTEVRLRHLLRQTALVYHDVVGEVVDRQRAV